MYKRFLNFREDGSDHGVAKWPGGRFSLVDRPPGFPLDSPWILIVDIIN
jgi:hypothetical protein